MTIGIINIRTHRFKIKMFKEKKNTKVILNAQF